MQRTIAIAGLGAAFREIHLPAYRKVDQLKVVAGADPALSPGDSLDFPVFRDVQEMLDETRPDVLAVATPPQQHFELVRLGLLAGCHVVCEKPFMESMQQADEIVALARSCNRRVVVNNQYRFMNTYRQARECIGRPDFGDLLFLTAHQTFFVTEHTEAGWRGADPQRTCKEFGTHILDLCRYFFDEDPFAVLARMPKGDRPEGPDYLNLIQLEFSGDRVAHITLDRLCRGTHNYLSIRLDGSQGCLETRIGGSMEFAAGLNARTRRPFVRCDMAPGGWARLYQGEKYRTIARNPLNVFAHGTQQLLTEFCRALDCDGVPPNDAENNRRTLAVMLAACESGRTNERIVIDYSMASNQANTV